MFRDIQPLFFSVLIPSVALALFLIGKKIFSVFIFLVYSLCFATTFALIFQKFYLWFIFLVSAVVFFLVIRLLGKDTIDFEIPRRAWKWFCFLLILCISFQILEGYAGGQDARTDYLPLSRYIFTYRSFPSKWTIPESYDLMLLKTAYPPLLCGLGGLTFLLVRSAREWVVSFIPTIFFVGFLVVIFRWCSDEKVNPDYVGLLLLLSPFFIERNSWFYSEGIFVFASTLVLYSLLKFYKEKREIYLYYAMIGSCIGMLNKYTGVFFTLFVVLVLLYYEKLNAKVWFLFLLLHFPVLGWYVRNSYIFGNPIPPLMNFLTVNQEVKVAVDSLALIARGSGYNRPIQLIGNFLIVPFLPLWFVLEAKSQLRKRGSFYLHFFLIFIGYSLIVFSLAPAKDFRYFMPFYGISVMRLGSFIEQKINNSNLLRRLNATKFFCFESRKVTNVVYGGIFLLVLSLQTIYIKYISVDRIAPYRRAIAFLAEKENAGEGTRIFVDTDHGFRWYGKYFVLDPTQVFFSEDFLKHLSRRDYLSLFKRYRVQYVVNSPWESPWENSLFNYVSKDEKNFQKIYVDEKSTMTIWKVK